MDTAFEEGASTLVGVAGGDASLYFSTGGGVIGAGRHPAVQACCVEWLAEAPEYLGHAEATQSFPLPAPDYVRFYFVTRAGVFSLEALEDDLGYGRHPLSPLFHQGHEVIAAIRETDSP